MIRVITFQSEEVVNILLNNKEYLADKEKMREGSLCKEDIANCDGNIPIWVFQHPAFRFNTVGAQQMCHMLQTFKEEMSIHTLDGLYMIELALDKQPVKGVAHNDSSLACVIPCIKLDNVLNIFKVELIPDEFDYFYNLIPISKGTVKSMFPAGIELDRFTYDRDRYPSIKLSLFLNTEEYYDYNRVRDAYVMSILKRNFTLTTTEQIIKSLSDREYTLDELMDEVMNMIQNNNNSFMNAVNSMNGE